MISHTFNTEDICICIIASIYQSSWNELDVRTPFQALQDDYQQASLSILGTLISQGYRCVLSIYEHNVCKYHSVSNHFCLQYDIFHTYRNEKMVFHQCQYST